jgi:hypothetical protein
MKVVHTGDVLAFIQGQTISHGIVRRVFPYSRDVPTESYDVVTRKVQPADGSVVFHRSTVIEPEVLGIACRMAAEWERAQDGPTYVVEGDIRLFPPASIAALMGWSHVVQWRGKAGESPTFHEGVESRRLRKLRDVRAHRGPTREEMGRLRALLAKAHEIVSDYSPGHDVWLSEAEALLWGGEE